MHCDCGYNFITKKSANKPPTVAWWKQKRSRWIWYVPGLILIAIFGFLGLLLFVVYVVIVEAAALSSE